MTSETEKQYNEFYKAIEDYIKEALQIHYKHLHNYQKDIHKREAYIFVMSLVDESIKKVEKSLSIKLEDFMIDEKTIKDFSSIRQWLEKVK